MLLPAIIASIMCIVYLVGLTFAWFTDSLSGSSTITASSFDLGFKLLDRTSYDNASKDYASKYSMAKQLFDAGMAGAYSSFDDYLDALRKSGLIGEEPKEDDYIAKAETSGDYNISSTDGTKVQYNLTLTRNGTGTGYCIITATDAATGKVISKERTDNFGESYAITISTDIDTDVVISFEVVWGVIREDHSTIDRVLNGGTIDVLKSAISTASYSGSEYKIDVNSIKNNILSNNNADISNKNNLVSNENNILSNNNDNIYNENNLLSDKNNITSDTNNIESVENDIIDDKNIPEDNITSNKDDILNDKNNLASDENNITSDTSNIESVENDIEDDKNISEDNIISDESSTKNGENNIIDKEENNVQSEEISTDKSQSGNSDIEENNINISNDIAVQEDLNSTGDKIE